MPFPKKPEIEYERSTLIVPLQKAEELVETVELRALLKLQRFEPTTNTSGYRQLEFEILVWEVGGHSDTLDGYLSFALSDVPQPRSVCVALQQEKDFPALMVYNAIYDLYLNGRCVLEKRPGIGIGHNVMGIPPRDIQVAFGKSYTVGEISALQGDCKDMASLEPAEFDAAVAEIKSLRAGL